MSAPGRLRHLVGAVIRDHGLWAAGERVAVAVSGGLDSVALLDLLAATRDWHGAALSVATVDHGTRPGSRADADFVVELADRLGLPASRFDLSLGPDAPEEACRSARYAALETLDVDRVAMAHHLEDQAETVLLALLRGTGVRGMAAMGWRRGRFVRPLLDTPRHALRAWAEHRGLAWVEDPTNTDRRFLRNRVRHEVMPLLNALRPGAAGALARSGRLAASDDALLDELSRASDPGDPPWPRAWLLETPEPLVRRALLRALPLAGARHLDAILSAARAGAGVIELPGGGRVVMRGDRVRVIDPVIDR